MPAIKMQTDQPGVTQNRRDVGVNAMGYDAQDHEAEKFASSITKGVKARLRSPTTNCWYLHRHTF